MSDISKIKVSGVLYDIKDEVARASGVGWTAEQITLLETVFANLVYVDVSTGQIAAHQLIESLRGVVPSDYIITQSGSTLIVSKAPATKSGSVLSIT